MKMTKKYAAVNSRSLGKSYRDNWPLVIMILPGLITILLFNYLPMFGLTMAFQDYRVSLGTFGSEWVGLKNFTELFTSHDFPLVLRNTLIISISKMLVTFPVPVILALLLNEVRNKAFKSTIQTFSYLPYFFSWVMLGGIIMNVFSYNGPFNQILKVLGLNQSIDFFGDPFWFIILLMISAVWQETGWSSVIYLASLSGVDDSLYEAATIDGAGRFKQAIHISLPTILPSIATVFILNIGKVLNAGFDQIFNLYNPTVYEYADILDTYVLRQLEVMEYSAGTALGLFKSVVSLILVLGANAITRKMNDNESTIF